MAPRTKVEKRVDKETGEKYTKDEFLEYYGQKKGQKIWDAIGSRDTKADAKPKAKAKAKAKVKAKAKAKAKMLNCPSLGVIRLDYDYPPAPGDIDSPESYGYDVFFRVVPGFTFEMCQSGKMTEDVKAEFIEAIRFLEKKGVCGITGDCGFMMYFQELARNYTDKPIFMSSLAQLPATTCAFAKKDKIAILTANSETLLPMRDLIREECGVDAEDPKRYVIVGCQDVPGFEAVALGKKVDVKAVTPGIVDQAKKVLAEDPTVKGFLFECTELPPYSDAVRAATGLPVWDAITSANMFVAGFLDNPRFGINHWHKPWDGKQEEYRYSQNLDEGDLAKLVNKPK